MAYSRITQHKPGRDEQKAKELVDVKRENGQLKKQVARLKKQLAKMIDIYGLDIQSPEDPEPMAIPDENVPQVEVNANKCGKCGGKTTEICPGGRRFLVCIEAGCIWRKRMEEE